MPTEPSSATIPRGSQVNLRRGAMWSTIEISSRRRRSSAQPASDGTRARSGAPARACATVSSGLLAGYLRSVYLAGLRIPDEDVRELIKLVEADAFHSRESARAR